MSSKAQDNNSLGLSDSTVMAEQASITAEGTSTSALGDEPTYDEHVREDIEDSDFSQVTDRGLQRECGQMTESAHLDFDEGSREPVGCLAHPKLTKSAASEFHSR